MLTKKVTILISYNIKRRNNGGVKNKRRGGKNNGGVKNNRRG